MTRCRDPATSVGPTAINCYTLELLSGTDVTEAWTYVLIEHHLDRCCEN